MFQVRFVKNVTLWKEMKPAFYHGHVSFLDFTKCVLCALVVPCANSLGLLRPMYLHEKCSSELFQVLHLVPTSLRSDLPTFCIGTVVFLSSQQPKKKKNLMLLTPGGFEKNCSKLLAADFEQNNHIGSFQFFGSCYILQIL